jgi:hypothetical protein
METMNRLRIPTAHRRVGAAAAHGTTSTLRRLRIAVAITVAALSLGLGAASGASVAAATANPTTTITTNWTTFFSGKTSASRKIALLENGSSFASVINSQASSALAKSVTAKVAKVANLTKSTASVRYSILLGGSVALANQLGTAVLKGGSWKVSAASFCVLLGLEGVKAKACPKG